MIPTIYELTGGGRLTVCSTDRFKSGLLSISFALPIEREQAWKTSLLLSVLRRGTQKYPSLAAINQRLDYLYGTELSIRNFYRGDAQVIGFCADILDERRLPAHEDLLCGALDMMRQILFYPLLDENGLLCAKYVESEKKQQCDQIRAQKNNPRGYASDRCRALLYRDHPCGASVLGSIREIRSITPGELTRHWKQLLTRLTPTCFLIGAEDPLRVKHAVEEMIVRELAGNAFSKTPFPAISRVEPALRALRRKESLPVGQSQLVLGLQIGATVSDQGFYAASLYNELLGASPISKLFMNVRERLSLCYFCSSHYNAFKGTVTIHCGLDRNDRARAEKEILAQIRALAQGELTDAELAAAKRSLTNAYRQMSDSPAALENFYFGRTLAEKPILPDELCLALEAVTREQVTEIAKSVSLNVNYFLCGTAAREVTEDEND